VSRTPADWVASLDLGDAAILALIPNQAIDRLSAADRERLCGLLAQEHIYRRHAGNPVADWNAAQTRAEIGRLTGEEPGRDHR
jgi:hypothetical protein